MMRAKSQKTIIGSNTIIEVEGIKNVPAKVDTGADSSSIWASNITINDQKQLEFTLFAPASPLFTGEIITADKFKAKRVRNSTGDVTIRYQVELPTSIKGRKINVRYTLADRSRNKFPVLIGRRTLHNKFLVDVSEAKIKPKPTFNNRPLNAELQENPQEFHQKYMK